MIAYVEMIGGASGNMLLGALLDAGADGERVLAALRTIPVRGWSFERRAVEKRGIAATYCDFIVPGEDHHPAGDAPAPPARRLAEVLDVLERSDLSPDQKRRARAIYERLGAAEARAHGRAPDEIHFHEVGATDAILDVAAACVALDDLGVTELFCSAFPLGRGAIAMHHGRYPNPPPATAELLRESPTYDAEIEGEMVTTTGAAILTSLVRAPGVRPPMIARRIGYGAGRSEFALPNVLRVSVGEPTRGASFDEVAVLEANVDDMQPQHFELAVERVLAAGAHDVWLTAVTMKKGRPAVLFGALAPPEREAAVALAMLSQTTSLGVRARRERRYVLERRIERVETPLGAVRVKHSVVDGAPRRTLEYDDVVEIARRTGLPVADVARRLEESLPAL